MTPDPSILRGPGRDFSPGEATRRRNPQLWPNGVSSPYTEKTPKSLPLASPLEIRPLGQVSKSALNKTEARFLAILEGRGHKIILKQAITLALDPPFKSYRPDLAYVHPYGQLVLWEIKGPHRFREKGIAKVALAAKTYPMLEFHLAEWTDKGWKETALTK